MGKTQKVATKKVATKKVGTQKVAKAGKSGNGKLALATMIMGWISFVLLVAGVVVYAIVSRDTENAEGKKIIETVSAVIIVIAELLAITVGALLIAKSKKFDVDAKRAKIDLVFGALTIALIAILAVGAILGFFVDKLEKIGFVLAVAGAILIQISCLTATIINTVWFAKARKGAKKPAAKK